MIDIQAKLQIPARPFAQASRPAQEDERAKRPLVLVVEDHAATQNVLSCVLDLQGYQPACVANGQEALEWLERAFQTKQHPAVILLDLFMPVMNGAHFLACMRARWQASLLPMPPVILFTVDQGNHDNLACTEVLPKPFHIRDLLEKLRLVLGQDQINAC